MGRARDCIDDVAACIKGRAVYNYFGRVEAIGEAAYNIQQSCYTSSYKKEVAFDMPVFSLSGRVAASTTLAPLDAIPVRLYGPASALKTIPGVQIFPPTNQVRWTRQLTGFGGSRWECWTKEVQTKVPGITWEQFRDEALLRNPQLHADGRLFRPHKAYLIPEATTTPNAMVETRTDTQGNYTFALPQAASYELRVEAAGHQRFLLPVVVNTHVTQPILLVPLASGSQQPTSNVRSARPDYASLPDKIKRLIGHALAMLGDDGQVFDTLPSELRQMCYGAAFLANPNHPRYKDFACADVVSIVLKAAGCNIAWGSAANPHMADYYHPDRGNSNLIEVTNPRDWYPGDILVYGSNAPSSRAGHVNMYVGPFSGVDRSGKAYGISDGVDVVEGSLDFWSNGRELGTGIIGCNLQRCLQSKRGAYTWVRHVRLRELAALRR